MARHAGESSRRHIRGATVDVARRARYVALRHSGAPPATAESRRTALLTITIAAPTSIGIATTFTPDQFVTDADVPSRFLLARSTFCVTY